MTVRSANEGIKLDLGGIGKGHALERAAELLRDAGVENAFLHGGASSVFAFGHNLNGNSWQMVGTLSLSSEKSVEASLFTGQWHFIGKDWRVPILRDSQRKWVVGIDDKDQKVLRGLTLTDFDVKSSGSR